MYGYANAVVNQVVTSVAKWKIFYSGCVWVWQRVSGLYSIKMLVNAPDEATLRD